VICATAAAWLAGCATSRLNANAPKGVDLTGEWQLNTNLSDDPSKVQDEQRGQSRGMHRHGGGPGGGGGGGGLPPFGVPGHGWGGGDDFTGATADGGVVPRWQVGGPGSDPGAGGGPYGSGPYGGAGGGQGGQGGYRAHSRSGGGFSSLLDAPNHLTIEQGSGKLTIQSKAADGGLSSDEYTPGQNSTVSFGRGTADRSVGWKGKAFIIETKAQNGPSKQDAYALDDDGRLIVTTRLSGQRMPNIQIKRVYDRVTNSQGAGAHS
jgi:hypothetical protein